MYLSSASPRGQYHKEEKHDMTMKNEERNLSWERELEGRLRHLPVALRCYDVTDSTNTRAKEYVLSGEREAAVFVANSQTAGRGRMGRSFFSPKDTGVYLSLLIPVEGTLAGAVSLTSGAAVAVARAIAAVTGIEVSIKWVNDLYYRGRKVCGILAESFVWEDVRYVILGVGVNLDTEDFPEELRERAGSLLKKNEGDRLSLTVSMIEHLYEMMTESGSESWIEEYRSRSMVLGQPIVYWIDGEARYGQAVAIEEDGALVVLRENGERERLSSGEITLRVTENKGGCAHE